MVVCKYFLRGVCRFGENCKNEHVYTDNSASAMRKKPDVDPSVLIKAVSSDMDKAEKGNQWPLSCYGPLQGKSCFPGFEDKCFEEIRLGMYEAEKNGTLEQYKQQLTQLLHEARIKMRSLLNPTAEASHILLELYNVNVPQNQSSNVFANVNTFGSNSVQSNSVFGNYSSASNNIFANQASTANNNFTFALPENKSIFGNATSAPLNTNSGSIFGNQPAQQPGFSSSNIFGAAQSNQNVFASTQQNLFQNQNANTSNYSQSIFGSSPSVTNSSPFGSQPVAIGNRFNQNVPTHASPFAQNNPPPNPFKQNIQTTNQSPFGLPATNQSPFAAAGINPTPFIASGSTQPSFASVATNQSPFSSVATNPPPFGASVSTQAPFGASSPPAATVVSQSAFGTPSTNQLPFASTGTNQSLFATNQQSFGAHQSPFAAKLETAVVNQLPFGSVSINQAAFGTNQSVFGAPGGITENRSIFAQHIQPQSVFSQNSQIATTDHSGSSQITVVAKITRQDDPTVYSKLEDLSEEDVKAFEASCFEFGKIPNKPPTLQMCL